MILKKILCCVCASFAVICYAEDTPMALENSTTAPSTVISPSTTSNDTLVAATNVPNKTTPSDAQDFVNAWGVSAQISTLGIGLNVSHALYSDYLNLRGQYNYLAYNTTINVNDVDNNARLNFNTLGLLLDYMPFGGSFRITGGLYHDNRSVDISGSNVSIGDNLTGSGNAGIKFSPIAPYLGIGVGSQAASSLDKKGFMVSFDAGVLFQNPSAYANLTCNSTTPGACDQAQFDQQKQQWINDTNNSLGTFGKLYPVLSFGLGYRF